MAFALTIIGMVAMILFVGLSLDSVGGRFRHRPWDEDDPEVAEAEWRD